MMPRPARLLPLVLAASLLGTTSCAVGRYVRDRALDLTDVIDIKYGISIGVGAKVEATMYAGAGVGGAALGYVREWYGRRSTANQDFAFFHLVLFGVDGAYGSGEPRNGVPPRAEVYFLLANGTALSDHNIGPRGRDDPEPRDLEGFHPPPVIDRWRFGGEVLLPVVTFGLYLNLGELVDFFVGFTTIDIADDDGIPKSATYYGPIPDPPPEEPGKESKPLGAADA